MFFINVFSTNQCAYVMLLINLYYDVKLSQTQFCLWKQSFTCRKRGIYADKYLMHRSTKF